MGLIEFVDLRRNHDRVGPVFWIVAVSCFLLLIGLIVDFLRIVAFGGGIILIVFIFYAVLIVGEKF